MSYQPVKNEEVSEKYYFLKQTVQLPKIVFFLTLNGRSSRQVFRLIKSIYDDFHYYYFHIDSRMTFMRKEITNFIRNSKKNNFIIANWSMSTIWGGASLRKMHLKSLGELHQLKKIGIWNWDFVLNLSETDFPVK